MRHFASPSFWACYRRLPEAVRELADKNFELLKANPHHPSLHFKQIGKYRSVRIGLHYRALAVEIPDLAHELMRGLPEDRADRDLAAALSYLKSRKDVKPNRIGAIGWCMGGGYSLSMALRQPTLTSAVICYGRLATDKSALGKVNASICGIFGGQDRGIPAEGVRQFEKTLNEIGKKAEIHIYDNSGHAFMNPNNRGGYREADAKDAWAKIDAFFEKTLAK